MVKKRRLNTVVTKGKSRDRSPPSEDEVSSARDRFKGALEHLLPRNSEDESDSSDEDNWTTKKRIPIHRKKPTKRSDSDKEQKFQQSFVMKLFDRSVDLAQFGENTPLYPICRAWIANQPHQTYKIRNNQTSKKQATEHEPYMIKEEKDFDPLKDIYRLPPPEPPLCGEIKMRVPEKFNYVTKYRTMYKEGVEPPTKDELLDDNLTHWTEVRRRWLGAGADDESRYSNSVKVLTAMFNRAQRHFHM